MCRYQIYIDNSEGFVCLSTQEGQTIWWVATKSILIIQKGLSVCPLQTDKIYIDNSEESASLYSVTNQMVY